MTTLPNFVNEFLISGSVFHIPEKFGILCVMGDTKSSAMTSTLRCLHVLELLAESPFELGLSDLASILKTPKASAHRVCATLLEAGLVERNPVSRCYRLSPKSLWIGSGYLRHSAVYRAAFFPMQDLAKHVTGTVQLGILEDDHVLFIHSVGYPGSTEAFADVGLRRPLYATASGKLFLLEMPQAEIERLMSRNVHKFTEGTIVSLEAMQEEIAKTSQKGYATNREELLPGYSVIAGPVRNHQGRITAAISVTISSEQLKEKGEAALAALVRQAAHKASIQLGLGPDIGNG